MKVLLIGCIYSEWTSHFVAECLLKNNCEIWMLQVGNKWANKEYIRFYKSKGVHFIDAGAEDNIIGTGKMEKNYFEMAYGYFLKTKKIMKSGRYDLINLHFVDTPELIYAAVLKYILKARLVLSYWGSDLFCYDDKELHKREKFVRCADFVTFDNKDLEIKFKNTYKRMCKAPSETVLLGLSVLDIINEKLKSKTQAQIRQKWGIPNDKTVVAVGYNGRSEQQHVRVLEEIEKLDAVYREKIFLLLQMTYLGRDTYKKKVIAAAEKTGCEYMDIQRFLTDCEVAEVRIMTDIFINAQTTDAFSGSVCENLFSGTRLINARWLRYQEFKDHDFKFLEFEDFGEIGQLLKMAMEQEMDVSGNKELVWKLRSWEACAPKWDRAYRKALGHQGRSKY